MGKNKGIEKLFGEIWNQCNHLDTIDKYKGVKEWF